MNPQQNEMILVDSADKFIGTAEKLHTHQQGLLHRAFSVFIFNSKSEILLQRRNLTKYHSPGLWSNTCCSHAVLKEDLTISALKRLEFEMGMTATIACVGKFTYKAQLAVGLYEHEIDHVFCGKYNNDIIQPNPEEVCDTQWISSQNLYTELNKSPHLYTAWLKKSLAIAESFLDINKSDQTL